MKTLALIPHYNHPTTVAKVAHAMRHFGLDVLIVDDGSNAECQPILSNLVSQGIDLLHLPINGGKGAAVKAGLKHAAKHGYTHALQVDADAQHNLSDTPKLLQASAQQPKSLICGWPQYDSNAPKARLYGRKITDFWNMLHTCSLDIKDGMCGFRLYPIDPALQVIEQEYVGNRMDFDTEILIHLYWRNVPIIWIKTPVQYRSDGISHFNAWQDNVLISKMHARLFCKMLWRKLKNIIQRPSEK